MNNPLRYAGITFYQADFDRVAERGTVLQVVKNPSWMTPYVACMLVGIGMLAHFGTMLVRFLRRRNDEAELAAAKALIRQVARRIEQYTQSPEVGRRCRQPLTGLHCRGGFRQSSSSFLPAISPARHACRNRNPAKCRFTNSASCRWFMKAASNPTTRLLATRCKFSLAAKKLESGIKQVAKSNRISPQSVGCSMRFPTPTGRDERIFKVVNLDLLDTLGLDRRPKFWRYSFSELTSKKATDPSDPEITTELQRQIKLAAQTPEKDRSLFQSKVLELAGKYNQFMVLVTSFRSPPLSSDEKQIAQSWQASQSIITQLNKAGAPHVVPPIAADANWTVLMQAELEYLRNRVTNQPLNPATLTLTSMLGAYARGDVATFNKSARGLPSHAE